MYRLENREINLYKGEFFYLFKYLCFLSSYMSEDSEYWTMNYIRTFTMEESNVYE